MTRKVSLKGFFLVISQESKTFEIFFSWLVTGESNNTKMDTRIDYFHNKQRKISRVL